MWIFSKIKLCWNSCISLMFSHIIGGSCHKYYFCHDKNQKQKKLKCLSRQTYFSQTRVCRDKSTLVASKLLLEQCLLRQTFCRDKHCLSRLKTCFVATNTCLLRQIRVCRDKTFVATKWYLWQFPPMIFPSTSLWGFRGPSNYNSFAHSFRLLCVVIVLPHSLCSVALNNGSCTWWQTY